jgi:hypothetical protein
METDMSEIDSVPHRFALVRRSSTPSITLWPDIASMVAVHGHGGATLVEWLDAIEHEASR